MAMDNKHNLAQREQFYAAVQKGASTPERIPGNTLLISLIEFSSVSSFLAEQSDCATSGTKKNHKMS